MYEMVWTCGRASVELKQIKDPDDEIKFIVGITLALMQLKKAYRRISFFALITARNKRLRRACAGNAYQEAPAAFCLLSGLLSARDNS